MDITQSNHQIKVEVYNQESFETRNSKQKHI